MFKAIKEGTCSKCEKPITPGQYISWNRHSKSAWHVNCKEPLSDVPPKNIPEPPAHIPEKPTAKPAPETRVALMEEALRQFMGHGTVDEAKVKSIVEESVRNLGLAREVVFKKSPELPGVKVGLTHRLFEKLVKLIQVQTVDGNHVNVYMHGPAGSGKSTAASQAAKALEIPYGYTSLNPQTPESRLIGFIHAGGQYVETEFFKRYTQGGVYCLDEIDNAASSLITTLNSLLENGHGAFPHGIFPRHKDFVCVCTANTIGRGGNINYPERRALDGAFLDRFHFIEWTYDDSLVKAIVYGILGDTDGKTFMDRIDESKTKLQSKYPSHIVSPRAYIQGAAMLKNGFVLSDILDSVVFRGVKL